MENHTFTSWPSNIMSCWSFSGAKKPFGSPMFDAIRGDWEGLKEAVQYMKKFPFQQSGVKQVCVCPARKGEIRLSYGCPKTGAHQYKIRRL